MNQTSMRARHGFTLVEILIAVSIIGILLTIAIPQFQRSRAAAQGRACQHNLKQIMGAKERWAMDNNMGATATPIVSDLVPDYIRAPESRCPGSGTYTMGNLGQIPTCSVGGTPGAYDAHVLP